MSRLVRYINWTKLLKDMVDKNYTEYPELSFDQWCKSYLWWVNPSTLYRAEELGRVYPQTIMKLKNAWIDVSLYLIDKPSWDNQS